jgi:hypothetical protein
VARAAMQVNLAVATGAADREVQEEILALLV